MPKGNRTADRKRGPKPGSTRAPHREGCECVTCTQPDEPAKAWKLPAELTPYIRERGGGPWLAELVRRERKEEEPLEARVERLSNTVAALEARLDRSGRA